MAERGYAIWGMQKKFCPAMHSISSWTKFTLSLNLHTWLGTKRVRMVSQKKLPPDMTLTIDA
jgi:hypothetical protein